jgi:hypothetical protein
METRDSKSRFALFGSIAAQYAGFEKGERAIEIASEIQDDAQRTSALSQVATVLTMQLDDDKAKHALNAISEDADRAFALIGMSDAKQGKDDDAGAIALLDEATHLVDEVPQLTSRSLAYNEIISRFISKGAVDKARPLMITNFETIGSIRDESSRVVALAGLGDLLAGAGLDTDIFDDGKLTDLLRKAG